MRVRRDGEETRRRILEAALQVFGEKGFHDATHAEICGLAGANPSAVNYHFHSKEDLYRATYEHAAEEVDALYPPEGSLSADAPAEDRLRAHVAAWVRRALDERFGAMHKLLVMETANPTGYLDDVLADRLRRNRARTRGVLAEIVGVTADAHELDMCEFSFISQCHGIRVPHGHRHPGPPWGAFTTADEARLIDHITRFCLAGLEAVRESLECRGASDDGGSA